jgi:hypothetical protein
MARRFERQKLEIEGPLRVIETTGQWGVYEGERIVVGSGLSFRDDLGVMVREAFDPGFDDGGTPSEPFALPRVRITVEVVDDAVDERSSTPPRR